MEDLAELVARAALENARWCDLVCHAHGAPGELHESCWLDRHPVPPYYPRLVTLAGPSRAAAQLDAVRALVEADPHRPLAVKDSFGTLDLAPFGFRRLLAAEWILWPPGRPAPDVPGPVRWRTIPDADGLVAWEDAWRGPTPPPELAGLRMFPAALREAPEVRFLAGEREGRIVATGVLHASDGVVGISNVTGEAGSALQACVVAARAWRPGQPVVGYEGGGELEAALAAGFRRLGALVVWERAPHRAG